jgi:phage host-nuclease inhibitor protein Gam
VFSDLSREEYNHIVTGIGTGPGDWRESQSKQAVLAEQTRKIAERLDSLGFVVRRRLAKEVVDLFYMLENYKDHYSDLLQEELNNLRYLMLDETEHHQNVCRSARDLLAEGARETDDFVSGKVCWPAMHEADRQSVRRWIKAVSETPWATPTVTETPIMVGLVTGSVKEIEAFRDLRMLPVIAQRERRPVLNAARYWLENMARRDKEDRVYARYLVVTNGQRVGYDEDLSEAISSFHRKISKWAKLSRDRFGMHIQLRASELTFTEDGGHLHSNLIVEPERRLGPQIWDEYLADMRAHFAAHCHDAGRIEDVSEIVKYVSKPTEVIEQIIEHEDSEERTEWLYRGLMRARLVQPLGDLRHVWRGIESGKLKPVVVGKIVRLVPKFRPNKAAEKRPIGENVIVSEMLAGRAFTPWAEPAVMLFGYTKEPTTRAGQRNLLKIEQMAETALASWTKNKAPAPAIALAIANAWLAADTDEDAAKIRALTSAGGSAADALASFIPPCAAGKGGAVPSIVHTTRVTVHSDFEQNYASGFNTGPPPGCFVENGWLCDSQTGEIFGEWDEDRSEAA